MCTENPPSCSLPTAEIQHLVRHVGCDCLSEKGVGAEEANEEGVDGVVEIYGSENVVVSS